MKKLITFGMALIALTQINAATLKSTVTEQGDSFNEPVTEKKFAPVEDRTVLNPATVLAATDQRQIEEVIAEDNKIIESTPVNDGNLIYLEKTIEEVIADDSKIIEAGNTAEIRPLYLERTAEDKIQEDNAIIESTIDEVQPLDFETINKKQMIIKKAENKQFVG